MRSLQEYLIESTQQYEYRIKIAGELSKEQVESMEQGFAKFDMVSLSEPKRLPISENPLGFEGVKNEEINILDAKFNYPASTEQFTEICKQAGIAGNKIIVVNKAFDDSMNTEENSKEKTPEEGALLDSDLPEATKDQIEASKAYTNGEVIKNATSSEYEIAGKDVAPNAETTNDLPQGTESPLSNVKLGDKPETGVK